MDGNKTEFVDKTILNTPKPTACSTVDRKPFKKKMRPEDVDSDNSLGIINVADIHIPENQIQTINAADLSNQLEQQRLLANDSLQRANKVTGIPSKYLKPNLSVSSYSNLNLTNESTISESDLTKSPRKIPKNTSTPRASVASNAASESRLSLGQSMAQLSYQIGNTDISIDNFVKEFQKAMNSVDKSTVKVDSQLFCPAEEAASVLLADEMSWRRQNEMPIGNFSQVTSENVSLGQFSVGEFFQQKSDSLSALNMAVSPVKSKNPIPLIEPSISYVEEKNQKAKVKNKSLSISAINRYLAETEDTPRKLTSFLLKQGQKLSQNDNEEASLPVSKNSSYTSNYSENEAIRRLVSDKENIDMCNFPQKDVSSNDDGRCSSNSQRPLSAGSSRSVSSALTSLPNGKLPIDSTKSELIWGCVKVNKCSTQDFLIRNKTSKRLCMQMTVSGYNFKIRKDNRQESETLGSAKLLLHPHESRAIIVSFIPTKIGAAVDELCFMPLDSNLEQTRKQSVKLFGYGGFGKIEVLNLTKDVTGKFWLNLGKLDNQSSIKHSFIIKNVGTLPSFAYIAFNPKQMFCFANVSVSPNFCVLLPNEQKEASVTFSASIDDHRALQSVFMNNMVAEIGNLLVISGTEVNRGRLRRLCRKILEKGSEIDPLSSILKGKIKGEAMPSDLGSFKESPGNMKEILKLFTRNEVIVTIEQDPELTMIPQYPDESGMFQTLCQDSTIALEMTTIQAACKLEPASIILTPPTKIKDCFFLISECKKAAHYEIVSNPEGLVLSPKDGIILPRDELLIDVTCPELTAKEKMVYKVLVYVENEVLEATVKIIFIHSAHRS